jgi:hypothetical protein
MILAVLYPFVEPNVDYGHRYDACPDCGATAHIHHLYLFGIGGDYYTTNTEGIFSKFIQEQNGSPCDHPWITIESYSGTFRSRKRGGQGDNYLYFRNVLISETEARYPFIREFLDLKAETDPDFLPRAKAAMKGEDFEKVDLFFAGLDKEVKEWRRLNNH